MAAVLRHLRWPRPRGAPAPGPRRRAQPCAEAAPGARARTRRRHFGAISPAAPSRSRAGPEPPAGCARVRRRRAAGPGPCAYGPLQAVRTSPLRASWPPSGLGGVAATPQPAGQVSAAARLLLLPLAQGEEGSPLLHQSASCCQSASAVSAQSVGQHLCHPVLRQGVSASISLLPCQPARSTSVIHSFIHSFLTLLGSQHPF